MEFVRPTVNIETGEPENFVLDPRSYLPFLDVLLDDYERANLSALKPEELATFTNRIEQLKTRVDAVVTDVAHEVEERKAGRSEGFFSAAAYLRHHAHLSSAEARQRIRNAHLFELLPNWERAARAGDEHPPLGSDQLRLMARVAANPRVTEALIEHSERLLDEARTLPYEQFKRRLRDLERSADHAAEARRAQRLHDARNVTMTQKPDGSWSLRGTFGTLQGAQVNETLAHFNDAEFTTDWRAAQARSGNEQPSFDDLERTEPQRRADALAHALECASTAPGNGAAPLPTLNVLIDETTLEAAITGAPLDASRYRHMVCRTQNGDPIDVSEAAGIAL